ncbi:hypothetical protein DL93DRAFT_2234056 [Clavulina sp. PMI_390]|nr:hypothetical protein DL93DRAFT_2234056 [Clavulina sp. PMI_390]
MSDLPPTPASLEATVRDITRDMLLVEGQTARLYAIVERLDQAGAFDVTEDLITHQTAALSEFAHSAVDNAVSHVSKIQELVTRRVRGLSHTCDAIRRNYWPPFTTKKPKKPPQPNVGPPSIDPLPPTQSSVATLVNTPAQTVTRVEVEYGGIIYTAVLITNPAAADEWIANNVDLKHAEIVLASVDTESQKATKSKPGNFLPCCLISIAIHGVSEVALFWLDPQLPRDQRIPENLAAFLAKEEILKGGCAIEGDAKNILDASTVKMESIINLSYLAKELYPSAYPISTYEGLDVSLSSISESVCGVKMLKDHTVSDWETGVYSEAMIKYAAIDAIAGLCALQRLLTGHPVPSPPWLARSIVSSLGTSDKYCRSVGLPTSRGLDADPAGVQVLALLASILFAVLSHANSNATFVDSLDLD